MEPSRTLDEALIRPWIGRLQGFSVPDLIWTLGRARRTGALHVRRGSTTRTVYFEEGRIVFASSTDPNERLGEVLVRNGLITLVQLENAAKQLGTGTRLGSLLVEEGHLSSEDLVRSVRSQVRSIVLGLFPEEEGEYEFVDGPLPQEEIIQLGVHTGELVLEGIRQVRSFTLIRRGVGTQRTWYRVAEGGREQARTVALTEGETALLTRLESGASSVERLCDEALVSNFEIYQALWAFKVLGIVETLEARPEEIRGEAGRLGESEFIAVLVRLCRTGETGVLRASRGSTDRTFHLKEGRCVFATSSNPDDGLVSHLFRRGVISLHDREEVARRLLTNRRVGTLLLEMGVLDEDDLVRTVREQVSEIVYDTVCWTDGEFVFTPGGLPTIEEITLDSTIESLTLSALRRVPSWTRILHGLGGLDARVALAPGYLDVLDRMHVGSDEWDLVAALGVARSVRELCQTSGFGDFRVCQTLWAFRLVDAIADAPAPAPVVEREEVRIAPTPPVEPAAATPRPEPERAPAPEPVAIAPPSPPTPEPVTLPSIAPPVEEQRASAVEIVDLRSTPDPEPALDASGPPTPTHIVDPFETTHERSAESEASSPPPVPAAAAEEVAEPVSEEPLDPDFERQVERFNACQQMVFRAVRAEVGAGAANFLRFCGARLSDGFGDLFAEVDLHDDGTWDRAGLRSSMKRRATVDPWLAFQRLIDKELEMVYVHLGQPQAAALRKRIEDSGHVGAARS